MIRTQIEDMLAEVAVQGVANADFSLLRELALRVWNSNDIPRLSQLPPDLWADAGYLVETLIRQRACSAEHQMEVLTALTNYKRRLPIPPVTADRIAAEWGATSSVLPRLAGLQYNQAH